MSARRVDAVTRDGLARPPRDESLRRATASLCGESPSTRRTQARIPLDTQQPTVRNCAPMYRWSVKLCVLVSCAFLTPRAASAGSCERGVVEHVWSTYTKGSPTPSFGDPGYDGYVWCFYPYTKPPDVVHFLKIKTHKYHCATNKYLGYSAVQGCTWLGKPTQYWPEGDLESANTCGPTCKPPDLACDALDQDLEGVPDEGCLGGEFCGQRRDADQFPYRFASGRVETQPIIAYSAPAPRDVFFGIRLQYGSELRRTIALRNSPDTSPTIHGVTEDTHFIGTNWLDNFSDRLIPPPSGGDGLYVWIGNTGTVDFKTTGNGPWSSEGGRYTLRRGTTGTTTRYTVTSNAIDGPVKSWVFDVVNVKVGTATKPVGMLVAYGAPDNPVTLTGGYLVTITRLADNRIDVVSDSFGREISFAYSPIVWANATKAYRVDSMSFRNSPAAAPTLVAKFDYTSLHPGNPVPDLLERIDLPLQGTYRRFRYFNDPGCDPVCGAKITEVIAPASSAGASSVAGAPPLASEEVVEGHEWCVGEDCQPDDFYLVLRPMVKRTWGPGRDWGYERTLGDPISRISTLYQLDLHQPDDSGTDCDTGCATGYRCWQPTNLCYRYTEMTIDTEYRQVRASAGARYPSGGGESHQYLDGVNPISTTDLSGSITSYGESPGRSLMCSIAGDDDYLALNAAKDDCDPPASGEYYLTKQTRTATAVEIAHTSVVQPDGTSSSTKIVNQAGAVTSFAVSGWTAAIDGSVRLETQTTTYGYDAFGRLRSTDGPLANATAYDVVRYDYWPDDSDDRGRLRYVTTFVGTEAEHRELRWEYSNYDTTGVARTVVAPNGARVDLVPSSPLDYEVVVSGPASPTQTQRIQLNANGTLRTVRYGAGACLTYEYQGTDGYAPSPSAIKRTSVNASDCDVLPIDRDHGTVAVFDYAFDEPDRLLATRVLQDGNVVASADGFVYSPDRRLLEATSPHSPLPHVLSYEDGVPVAQWSPGWPAADSWRVDSGADELGRASSLDRYVAPTDKIAANLFYANATAAMPSRVETGFNGTTRRTVYYSWDDFGRLISSTVPEHGVTRWEYAESGKPVRIATAVGTSTQAVRSLAYDSLGRLTSSHYGVQPADCGGLPDGAPVERTEFRYDACDSPPLGFECEFALGRLASTTTFLECRAGVATEELRYFAYTATGLLESVAVQTTASDGTSSEPVFLNYFYTGPDGALSATALSIAESSTTYLHDNLGQISAIGDGTGSLINDIARHPNGAIGSFATPNGLRMDRGYNFDGSPARVVWRQGLRPLVNQEFEYYSNGLIKHIADTADARRSRYYEYDRLLRLTCEARGVEGTVPGPADCTSESPRVLSLFGYGAFDGSSAHDSRALALQKTGAAASGDLESLVYESGSMRPRWAVRGDTTVDALEYDSSGRRTRDERPSDPSSRRDYAYWPSGRIREISGVGSDGAPYTIVLSYDSFGLVRSQTRHVNGVINLQREFFWNADGTLAAVRETSAGHVAVWIYHSLGGAPLAVTREEDGTSKNYWFVTDSRGMLINVVDAAGSIVYSADFDAGGWPFDVVNADGIYVPFGLPGQLSIPESSPGVSGGRVALGIAGGRAYDPRHQVWLSPDPADATYRPVHEGYSYARSNPVAFTDPGGTQAQYSYWLPLVPAPFQSLGPGKSIYIHESCQSLRISTAIATAMAKIRNCSDGPCGFPGGETFKRQWLAALSWGSYYCPEKGKEVYSPVWQLIGGAFDEGSANDGKLWTPDRLQRHYAEPGAGLTRHQTAIGMADRIVMYAPSGSPCGLAAFVGHEAAHTAAGTMWWWEPFFGHGKEGPALWGSPWLAETNLDTEKWNLQGMARYIFRTPPDDDFQPLDGETGFSEAFARWASFKCLGCQAPL
jgi:YD repeat-containing protein